MGPKNPKNVTRTIFFFFKWVCSHRTRITYHQTLIPRTVGMKCLTSNVAGGGGRTHSLLCRSHLTIDHASLSRRSTEKYSFPNPLFHLVVDVSGAVP